VASAPAISVDGLRVVRGGRTVLPGLSTSILGGAVTGLLGPNGSGKSTLMRAIVGVQRIESGTVHVLGEEAGSPKLRARVGYMTQAPSVYGDLTVEENLRYFARILRASAAQVDAAVTRVALAGLLDNVVNRLSGGQRARVSLATALLNEPDVLVLDEPTVGLDPVLRDDLWRTLRGLAADGATVLVSSHVMDEAAHCDRLLLLYDGRVLADEPPAALLERTSAPSLDEAFLRLVREAPAR
jgi:ABC-2 type transport system ATP-binding protein